MTTVRIAVMRIPFDVFSERFSVESSGDGWGCFEGADGESREVRALGDAILVRAEPSALAGALGDLWSLHQDARGVAMHVEVPNGESYDALVHGAVWEGGVFSSASSELGAPAAEREGEGGADEEENVFDKVAEQLLTAVEKRGSRKVLAARLAAEHGQKDLGDVLDALEAESKEGDDALIDEVESRFRHDPEQAAMAALLKESLPEKDSETEGAQGGQDPMV